MATALVKGRPPIPAKVGRYEVLLPIASGGMATVYLARSHGAGGFEREVAIKLAHSHFAEDPELSRQLLNEGKLVVGIHHANVCAVLDVGEDVSGLFLVMEYVEGDTLAGLSRQAGGLPPRIFLRILVDALAGLHAAHEMRDSEGRPLGLVHRDFTPQNILVGTDGAARLTDFGIAKATSLSGVTREGVIKGKLSYMSPEQVTSRPVDRRTDVWAAGVLAWELFAGRKLHRGDQFQIIGAISRDPAPLLRTINADIHPEVESAIAHALAIDVEARTPTAEAFAKELGSALRAASIDLAETSDVAAVVKQVAGPRLEERRRRVLAMTELASMRETQRVARAAMASGTQPVLTARPADDPAEFAAPAAKSGTWRRLSRPSVEPRAQVADPESTDGTVVPGDAPVRSLTRGRLLGIVSLGVLGLASSAILGGVMSRREPRAAPSHLALSPETVARADVLPEARVEPSASVQAPPDPRAEPPEAPEALAAPSAAASSDPAPDSSAGPSAGAGPRPKPGARFWPRPGPVRRKAHPFFDPQR